MKRYDASPYFSKLQYIPYIVLFLLSIKKFLHFFDTCFLLFVFVPIPQVFDLFFFSFSVPFLWGDISGTTTPDP